jgi:hypothetical protein
MHGSVAKAQKKMNVRELPEIELRCNSSFFKKVTKPVTHKKLTHRWDKATK